jgi:hypothetical protein
MLLVDLAIESLESFKVESRHFVGQNDLDLTSNSLKMS